MSKKYKSKVDVATYILIVSTIVVLLIPIVIETVTWLEVVISAIPGIFILDIVFFTDYTITNEKLVVRCGHLIRWNIPICKITNISSTRSLLSAPALSIERIIIKYGKYDEIVISPCRKEEFISDLKTINNRIVV